MLSFVKMHGLGNDFVVLDARRKPLGLSHDQIVTLADRRLGVGCDQLIVLEPTERADVFMRIYNPDGSQSGACGNATRCIGQILINETGSASVVIETIAGLLVATREGGIITVDMGEPVLEAARIPLSVSSGDTVRVPLDTEYLKAGLPGWFSAVNMGNPHGIFFVEDVNAHDIERVGPLLETHAMFPERANISFVSVRERGHLVQRVWERGAGLTLACGSGACAAAVAAVRCGLTDRKVTITLPGGDLTIEWRDDNHILMSGPVATAFSGSLDPALTRAA